MNVDEQVVQGLYEAAAGIKLWPEALGPLTHANNALVCQVVIADKFTGALTLCEQPDFGPNDAVLDYVRDFHKADPHARLLATLPVGQVVHTADSFPRIEYENHPFYQQFWRSYNVRALVGAKVGEDTRHVAMAGVIRSYENPVFTPKDVRLAGVYLGHLAAAFRISQHLRGLKFAATVGQRLMEASDRAMFLVNRAGGIVASNAVAAALLADGGLLRKQNQRLSCQDAASDRQLLSAIAEVGVGAPTRGNTPGQRAALRLTDRNGTGAFCTLWNLRPEDSMSAFGDREAILVTITHPRSGKCIDLMLLGSLFDMTPAESRVAAALMEGDDVASIAQVLHVSVQTIRSHLKTIFSKTGTHRQGELIQLLIRTTET